MSSPFVCFFRDRCFYISVSHKIAGKQEFRAEGRLKRGDSTVCKGKKFCALTCSAPEGQSLYGSAAVYKTGEILSETRH